MVSNIFAHEELLLKQATAQIMYSNEDLVQTAFRCSNLFRNAIESQLLAPLRAKVDYLQYSCDNLQSHNEAQAFEHSRVLTENDHLRACIRTCTEDVNRLRRQRNKAEEQLYTLEAQHQDSNSSGQPLLAYGGNIAEWPRFVQDLHEGIESCPQLYGSERSKCLLLLNFTMGPVREWAKLFLGTENTAVEATELDNFQVLLAKATLAWGDSGKEAQIRIQLMNLHLEAITTLDLAIYHREFAVLSARISWSKPAIIQCYKQGLPSMLRAQLEVKGVAEDLEMVQKHVAEMVYGIEQ